MELTCPELVVVGVEVSVIQGDLVVGDRARVSWLFGLEIVTTMVVVCFFDQERSFFGVLANPVFRLVLLVVQRTRRCVPCYVRCVRMMPSL